jgi:hypothetical protein
VNEDRSLQPPPWEQRSRYGLIDAFVQTVREVLARPAEFFQRMPSGLGLREPVLFALAVGVVVAVLQGLWAIVLGDLPARVMPVLGVPDAPLMWSGRLIGVPLLAVGMAFVRAAVFHGLLVATGGNKLGFEATFRVVAYARATWLLAIVPFCGGAIAAVWELAVSVVGLVRSHECEPWQALVAVLAPAVLLLLLAGGWGLMVVGLAALS